MAERLANGSSVEDDPSQQSSARVSNPGGNGVSFGRDIQSSVPISRSVLLALVVIVGASAFAMGATPVLAADEDFSVEIVDVPDSVTAGEDISVTANVSYDGPEANTTDVVFDIGGETLDANNENFDPGTSSEYTRSTGTDNGDVGTLDVEVTAGTSNATETVEVDPQTYDLTVGLENGDGSEATGEVTIWNESDEIVEDLSDVDGGDTVSLTNGTYDVVASDGDLENETTVDIDGESASTTLTLEEETVDVSGTVTDAETGEELEDATIHVDDEQAGSSDGDGTFGVNEDGNYTLTVEHDGYETYTQEVEGDEQDLAIELEPRNGSIDGEVLLGDEGDGATDVTITAENDEDVLSTTKTITDDRTFTIEDLPRAGDHDNANNSYNVTVEADGFEDVTRDDVAVAPGEHVALDDVVLGGEDGTISATVVDENGDSVENASVELLGDHTDTQETDADGNVTFENVPTGSYDVEATADGYATTVEEDVTVDPGEDADARTLALDPGGASIAGTISLDAPALDDRNDVVVTATDAEQEGTDELSVHAGDESQSYEIDGLQPGEYDVSVDLVEYSSSTETVEVNASESKTGQDIDLTADTASLDVEVDSESGAIENADVTVTLDHEDVDDSADTTTDTNGEATIDDLRQADYVVTVDHENYASDEETVAIEAGGTTHSVELAPADGSLSGAVTLDAPALYDGTEVELVAGADDTTIETTETVAAGEGSVDYTIEDVPANTSAPAYEVTADAEGYQGDSIGEQTVSAGEDSQVSDLTLDPETGSIDASVVSTFDDAGIESATVSAELVDAGIEDENETTASNETDESGDAEIEELRVGEYEVTAAHSNYESDTESTVEVTADESTERTFELEPRPGDVEGEFAFDPVPDADTTVTVSVYEDADGQEAAEETYQIDVDAEEFDDGTHDYTLSALAPGEYDVEATTDDYVADGTNVSVGANETVVANFDFEASNGSISGEAGFDVVPPEDTDVEVVLEDDDGQVDSTTVTVTDNDERFADFAFADVPANETYTLTATADGYADVTSDDVHVGPTEAVDAGTLELGANDGTIAGEIDLDVGDHENVNVTVERLDDEGNALETVEADDAGEYEFTNVTAGDEYTLEASAEGYTSAETTTFSVGPDETVTKDLSLDAERGTISGTVELDRSALEERDVEIVAEGPDGEEHEPSETLQIQPGGDQAEFEIASVPAAAGQYALNVSAAGYDGNDTTVVVGAGEDASIDDALLEAHTADIEVDVTDEATGESIDEAEVTAALGETFYADSPSVEDGEVSVTDTAADGNVTFEDVRVGAYDEGDYTVTADHENYESNATDVTVSDGETTEVEVELVGLPGSIAGEVVREDGEPIEGAEVELANDDADLTDVETNAVTDENGEYDFGEVPRANNYTVSVDADRYFANETTVDVGPNADVERNVTLEGVVEIEGGDTFGYVQDAVDEAESDGTISLPNASIVDAVAIDGEDSLDEPVDVDRSNLTISGAGEELPEQGADVSEDEHTVLTSGDTQIEVSADDVTIEGVYFDGADADRAITSTGDDTVVRDVLVEGHGTGGIALQDGTGDEITRSTVHEVAGTGIVMDGRDDVRIANVTLADNANTIELSGATGSTITDVTITDDGDIQKGLKIADESQDNVVSDVTIDVDGDINAAAVSIESDSTDNTVEGVDLTANDVGTAIAIDGASDNTINATAITDVGTGIELANADDNEFNVDKEIRAGTAVSITNADDNVFDVPSIHSQDESVGLSLTNADGNEFNVDDVSVASENKHDDSVGILLNGADGNAFDGLDGNLTLEDFANGVELDDGASDNQFTAIEIVETDDDSVTDGVRIKDATGNEFDDTRIDLNGDDGLHLTDGAEQNRFNDTVVVDGDVGAHLDGAGDNVLDGIEVDVGDRAIEQAVLLEDDADGNHVAGLRIRHENRDVETGVEVVESSDNVLTDGEIRFTSGDGIAIDRGHNTTVADSLIDESDGHGIYVQDYVPTEGTIGPETTTDVTVDNTTITNGAASGISLDGSEDAGINETTIANSTIEHNADNAVLGTYAHDGRLENNTINENDAHAVYLTDSTANAFADNRISANETNLHGVLLERSPDTTMDRDVVTNSDSGVKLTDESDGATLTGVTASDNDANGVWVTDESTNATIKDGWTENNTVGVLFDATDVGAHAVENNTIADNDEQGVFVDAVDENEIAENAIDENGAEGVLLSETVENALSANDVTANNASGIVLAGADDNTLENNDVSENAPYGVHTTDADDNQFSENDVTENEQEGVLLEDESSSNEFEDDVVTNNERGVDVTESSNDNVLTNVTASDNAEEGIRVNDATSTTIEDGTVEDNRLGILLTGPDDPSNHDVSNTTVASNEEHGIHLVDVSDNHLRVNDVANNGDVGIFLEASGSNTVEDNEVRSNDDGIRVDDADGNEFGDNLVEDHGENDGVLLIDSSETTFNGDEVTDNAAGVNVTAGSNDADVRNLTATSNDRGVHVVGSDDATIADGEFNENGIGVLLDGGDSGHEVLGNEFDGDEVSIDVVESSNNHLEGNDVQNAEDLGVRVFDGVDNLLLDNDIAGVDDGDGVLVDGATATNLTENVVDDNANGVEVTAGASDTEVEALEANGNGVGVHVLDEGDDANVTDTRVANGTFEGNEVGIEIDGADERQVVENNAIDGAESGDYGIVLKDSSTQLVTDNRIQTVGTTGIELADADDNDLHQNTVDSVSSEGGVGIALDNADNNDLTGSVVSNAFYGFQLIDSEKNHVTDSKITGTYVGLGLVETAKNMVTNNTIGDVESIGGHTGVEVTDGTDDTFESNEVRSQETGVLVEDSHRTVFANDTVTDNARVGVEITRDSNETELENLTATDNGIDIESPERSSPVPGAMLSGGVVVSGGDNATVANGTFEANAAGVLLTGGADHEVRNNTMTDQLLGVGAVGDIDTGEVLVEEGPEGVDSEVDDATIAENDVTTHTAGIVLANVTDANVTSNGVSDGNTDRVQPILTGLGPGEESVPEDMTAGILDVRSTETAATDNVVDDVGYGIAVADTKSATISGGSVTDATTALGIATAANDTTFADVTVEDASEYGVRIQGAENSSIVGGTVLDSGTDDVLVEDATNTTADGLALENETVTFAANDVNLSSVTPTTPGPDGEDVSLNAGLNATNQTDDGWIDLGVHYDDAEDVDASTLEVFEYHNGSWEALNSSVDTGDRYVASNVTNFSHFGAFGEEATSDPSPPPGPSPSPSPDPAPSGGSSPPPADQDPELVSTALTESAVTPGESVLVNATYDGNDGGDVNVTVSIDGAVVDHRVVTVDADATRTVSFERSFDDTAEYTVGAANETVGTVTVEAAETAEPTTTETATPTSTATASPTPEEGGAAPPADDQGDSPLVLIGIVVVLLLLGSGVLYGTQME